MIKSYHTEFFTATILRWQKLLQDNMLAGRQHQHQTGMYVSA